VNHTDRTNAIRFMLAVASTAISKELAQLASVKTPTQIEQTRVGLFDLRAELTTLREVGLSNFVQFGSQRNEVGQADRRLRTTPLWAEQLNSRFEIRRFDGK
jgi:hypothetical protein